MRLVVQIILALGLDALLGDPRWLPHPVRLVGRLAAWFERLWRRLLKNERRAGIATLILVLLVTGIVGGLLLWGAGKIHPRLGDLVAILMLYTCFAARDLLAHSRRVYEALKADDLAEARQRVALLVGRDTAELDQAGVVRACVESVAENSSDGIVAPLFWAVVGGPVGALIYKAISTLDSTFGYKNEQYRHFGWASARLDDLVNYIPARLAGVGLVAAALVCGLDSDRAWRIYRRDCGNHASPNSGHPEAAVAGALGLQLGGVSSYFGQQVAKPTMGDALAEVQPGHILAVNRLVLTLTVLAALVLLAGRLALVG
ncbi:MAG: cobalamin biosynthesis protein CobD [Desulfobulbaceae bacterium]|nr:cobalamin biosynthesis protein CobD [Desulfobulbaceae bacterium]